MRNVTKWSVLVLSIFALSFAACGGDDNEDDNNGGSGGSAGSAGTGGTGGTGGTAGQGGTGGTAGTGGTGGTEQGPCDIDPNSEECGTCINDAFGTCAGTEGGACAAEGQDWFVCGDAAGCVDQAAGTIDVQCTVAACPDESDALFTCLDTNCEEWIACGGN